jgi:death-on-curing protein
MNEPRGLLKQTVIALHELSLAAFGGRAGLRDPNLVDSALARARNLWAYGDEPSLYQMAAAIGYGLCKNHPFIDGNKRTAFISAAVFLERNGLHANAPEFEVVRVMNALAAVTMDERDFAAWLEQAFPRKTNR